MAIYDADAELRERKRFEDEVNVLGGMIADVSSARAQDAKNPTVVLQHNMWPPHFMAGVTLRVRFVSCEEVERGRFIMVRHRGQVHVVRYIGWKFIEGRTHLEFIPGPKDHRVVTSGDVELLGEVLAVVDKAKGIEIDPHKVNIFRRIWNAATNYGTGGFWSGLYRVIDGFVVDASSIKHEKRRHSESIFKTWNKVEGWRQEVESRKEAEEAQRQARKKGKKKRWNELEFDDDTIDSLPVDRSDEVREKLAKTSDAEMASWWTPAERMEQASQTPSIPRHRHPRN